MEKAMVPVLKDFKHLPATPLVMGNHMFLHVVKQQYLCVVAVLTPHTISKYY